MSSFTQTHRSTTISDQESFDRITLYNAEDPRATNVPAEKIKRHLCSVLTDDGDQNTTEVSYAKRMKVFHLQASQTYSGDITEHANAKAQSDAAEDMISTDWKLPNDQHHIRGRLPVLIASVDHDDPRWPCLETPDLKPRCLRLPAFLKLKKITDLSGSEYLKAWLDCLLCHAALWESNVHHCDINVGSLMYYRLGGQVYGALNDYDLMDGPTHTLEAERTGTWPFMAAEMLLKLDKKPPQIYDNDVESFLWCLLWTTHRYVDGKVSPSFQDELDIWTNRNPEIGACVKDSFMIRLQFNPTSSHKSSLYFIEDICEAFRNHRYDARQQTRLAFRNGTVPPSPPRLLPALLAAVKNLSQEKEDADAQVPPKNHFAQCELPSLGASGEGGLVWSTPGLRAVRT